MYAFADRLQPRPPDDPALAQLLMGVAAWALADQDTIDLEPLAHPRPVDGRLGFTRKRGYVEQPGLEGMLLLSMTGKGKETRTISMWWLFTVGLPVGWETEARHDSLRHAIETGPWRTRKPHKAVLAICKREARRAGVLKGGSDGELAFAEIDAGWRRFQSDHPELYSGLMDDCAAGLRRK